MLGNRQTDEMHHNGKHTRPEGKPQEQKWADGDGNDCKEADGSGDGRVHGGVSLGIWWAFYAAPPSTEGSLDFG